jgi:hypothetical protein
VEAVRVAVPLVVVLVNAVVVVVEREMLEAVKVVTALVVVGLKICPMTVTELIGLMVRRPILLPDSSLK